MPTRKRIRNKSGGGGGTQQVNVFGNVTWGPDFGETANTNDNTWNLNVSQGNFDTLELTNDKTLNVHQGVDLDAILENTKTVNVHQEVDIDAVLENSKTTRVHQEVSIDAVIENPKTANVSQSVVLDPIIENAKTVSVHMSGEATGVPVWMAVTTNGFSNALGISDFDMNVPSGVLNDDLLICFISCNLPNNTFTFSSTGWTYLIKTGTTGLVSVSFMAFYRRASSEPSSYNFTNVGTDPTAVAADMHLIRGVAQGTGTEWLEDQQSGNGSATDPALLGVTTTGSNRLVLALSCHSHTITQTNTSPSGYTERDDFSDGGVPQAVNVTSATRILPTATTTATTAFDCTSLVAANYATLSYAIIPGPISLAT